MSNNENPNVETIVPSNRLLLKQIRSDVIRIRSERKGRGGNTRKCLVRICIGPRKTAEGQQEGSSRERGRLPEAEKIPGPMRGGPRSLDLSRFVRVRFCNYFATGADEAVGTAGRQSRTREARR